MQIFINLKLNSLKSMEDPGLSCEEEEENQEPQEACEEEKQ